MTSLPPYAKPLFERIVVGAPGPRMRLVLELESEVRAPVTRKFIRHIDRVRTLLIRGRICPDDAHALLIDVGWYNRP